ncbi:MAG: cysteine--tRNA ligase, partial [Candidatus Magasanikbacteria bacterium]|nr:cysteine--tRNA ligase [Candidatus Magasanikbacteria bacterium]
TYTQNVTNIDDDILIRSHAAGTTWQKMGDLETKKHLENMDNLNVKRPDFYPKATENIPRMIEIIRKLIVKKFAYVKNNSVYFSVCFDKNFGKLSKFGYRAMLEIANERGNFPLDPNKKDPLDFVLWQAQKTGEPAWQSPWGKGRPGWHIECSAMSTRYLGNTITIHGGGNDLIFPHHEAEIAQTQNATGKKFVKIWMHAAMLYYQGKKLSKILGNMVVVSDLVKKYNFATIRLLLLSHQYRSPWNYEDGEIEIAQKKAELILASSKKSDISPQQAKMQMPDFYKALDDDFNTPLALEILEKYAKAKKYPQAIYIATQILGLQP